MESMETSERKPMDARCKSRPEHEAAGADDSTAEKRDRGSRPLGPRCETLVVPENSIRRDSRGGAESAHHTMRCLRSSTCLQRL
jgi:hypothetical protein